MIYNESDTNYTLIGVVDLEELGTVQYDETGMLFFYYLRKQTSENLYGVDITDPEVSRYIDVKWSMQHRNWNEVKIVDTDYPAKLCTKEDIGNLEQS